MIIIVPVMTALLVGAFTALVRMKSSDPRKACRYAIFMTCSAVLVNLAPGMPLLYRTQSPSAGGPPPSDAEPDLEPQPDPDLHAVLAA